jgi:acetyltransferase-like isoleucine patch superfamily enzyme
MSGKLRKGYWMLVERLIRLAIGPRLRSRLIRWAGADIGENVRIYEAHFINLRRGFRPLRIADDVHVGHGCIIDLEGGVEIGEGAVLSPGVVVMSHSDPGSSHDSPLVEKFGVKADPVQIGRHVWVGANATLLSGTAVGDSATIAAGAVVTTEVPAGETWGGVPARKLSG